MTTSTLVQGPPIQGTVLRRGGRGYINPDIIWKIIRSRGEGLSLRAAANEHGILQRTALRWKWLGERLLIQEGLDESKLTIEQKLYMEFADGLMRATAAFERGLLEPWRDACMTDWRAAMRYLEHYDPETWHIPTALTLRVQTLEMALLEAYQQRWADKQQPDSERDWNRPERVAGVAAILMELGLLDEHLDKIAAALASRGAVVQLPSRKAQSPAKRLAAIEDDQAAQDATAAPLSEEELLALAKRMCVAGECVSRRGRLFTCLGCGVTKSVALPAIEEIAA